MLSLVLSSCNGVPKAQTKMAKPDTYTVQCAANPYNLSQFAYIGLCRSLVRCEHNENIRRTYHARSSAFYHWMCASLAPILSVCSKIRHSYTGQFNQILYSVGQSCIKNCGPKIPKLSNDVRRLWYSSLQCGATSRYTQ